MCSGQAPCTADSAQAWIKCVALYNQGQAPLIAVTLLIDCDGDSCAATFNTQPSPVLIYAAAPGAGFAISGDYKNSIISAQSATNITIRGLLFEHNCWITTYNNSAGCSPTIGLYNCQSILIEGCAFESPNPWAISVWHTSFSVIANCTFRNGSMYEVWFDDEPDPAPNPVIGNVVEGCTFEDSWVEALHYHGRSTAEFPGIIRNNYFRHNQFNPIFYTCGPNGNQLCGGGQFSLNVPCTNVVVENNVFTGGSIQGHGPGYLVPVCC